MEKGVLLFPAYSRRPVKKGNANYPWQIFLNSSQYPMNSFIWHSRETAIRPQSLELVHGKAVCTLCGTAVNCGWGGTGRKVLKGGFEGGKKYPPAAISKKGWKVLPGDNNVWRAGKLVRKQCWWGSWSSCPGCTGTTAGGRWTHIVGFHLRNTWS